MMIPEVKELENHSEDEDVVLVEDYEKSFPRKGRTEQPETLGGSKHVYNILSSSQSDDERTKTDEMPVTETPDNGSDVSIEAKHTETLEEQNRDEKDGCLPPSDVTGEISQLQNAEPGDVEDKIKSDVHETKADGPVSRKPSHFDTQKRHLDDDMSFFFRGRNISEGIERAAAMYNSPGVRQPTKIRRKHHNLDVEELGSRKLDDKPKTQPLSKPVLSLKPGTEAERELSVEMVTGTTAPTKYDATYDPEFAKLMAKYTVRGTAHSSGQSQQEPLRAMLELRAVSSLMTNSLNIHAHYQRDGKASTLLFVCEMDASFGDINDALCRHFHRNFTLMYKKTPILSSLATSETLGIERGSVVEAFDDWALEALKTLQEKEDTRRRELAEAEQLASAPIELGESKDASEKDQESGAEQADSRAWTMCIRVGAKQTVSVQINPDDTISRLLCLALDEIKRPGASAVLVWDGAALPADAVIRDADLEDGDQLELHFRQG